MACLWHGETHGEHIHSHQYGFPESTAWRSTKFKFHEVTGCIFKQSDEKLEAMKWSKLVRNSLLTSQHLHQMRTWTAEFGQSVREQTVQRMTTKDSVGTLPVNWYETKAGGPKPVDFARLALMQGEICSDQSSSPEVLICEGTIVCVRKGSHSPIQPSPFYLARLDENVCAVESPTVKATYMYFAQDPLMPFQFSDIYNWSI